MTWLRRGVELFEDLDAGALAFYLRAHRRPEVAGWSARDPDPRVFEFVPAAPARVLDVGCGGGRHGHALAARGYEVVGVDLFERPLRVARARPGAEFLRAAATHLTDVLGNRRFDAVLDVLGPASDLRAERLGAYAAQVRALLAPGGRWIVFSFLSEQELAGAFAGFRVASREADAVGAWTVAYA